MINFKNQKAIVVYVVMCQFAITSTGCFRRLVIPVDRNQKITYTVLHVYLENGKAYNGKVHIQIREPEFEGEYLTGLYKKQKIYLSLYDVKRIEVIQPDKKKFAKGMIIGASIFIPIMVSFVLLGPITDSGAE